VRPEQFVNLLARLKLSRASGRTAQALGLSRRQLQRIVAGKSPVPRPVALLTIAYSKYGLPNPLWDPDVSRGDRIEELTRQLMKYGSRSPEGSQADPYAAKKALGQIPLVETVPIVKIVPLVESALPLAVETAPPPSLLSTVRAAKRAREQEAIKNRLKRTRR
jgi:hypothetical protein